MFGVPQHIFVEVPNIKIHENASGGNQADTCGRAGGHDEANSRSTLHIRNRLKRASLNGLTSSAARSCKFNNQDHITTSAKLKFVAAFEHIWPSHLKHTRLK